MNSSLGGLEKREGCRAGWQAGQQRRVRPEGKHFMWRFPQNKKSSEVCRKNLLLTSVFKVPTWVPPFLLVCLLFSYLPLFSFISHSPLLHHYSLLSLFTSPCSCSSSFLPTHFCLAPLVLVCMSYFRLLCLFSTPCLPNPFPPIPHLPLKI